MISGVITQWNGDCNSEFSGGEYLCHALYGFHKRARVISCTRKVRWTRLLCLGPGFRIEFIQSEARKFSLVQRRHQRLPRVSPLNKVAASFLEFESNNYLHYISTFQLPIETPTVSAGSLSMCFEFTLAR